MMFNATFNNISVISWRKVLLVDEITDLPQITDKFYSIMLYREPTNGGFVPHSGETCFCTPEITTIDWNRRIPTDLHITLGWLKQTVTFR